MRCPANASALPSFAPLSFLLLLLGDEPTGNLDSATGEEILSLLDDLRKEFNTTLFLVTHNDLAASFCDRVITLRDGRILKEQRPDPAPARSH